MKNRFICLLLFIIASLNLRGQEVALKNNVRVVLDTTNMRTTSQFEEDLKLIGMEFTPSTQYDVSYNIHLVSPCKGQTCPLKRLGLIHSTLTNHDGQCKVFVYITGAANIRYGSIIKQNKKIFGMESLSKYNRIKHDFEYGRPYSGASEQDIEDLKMMMTFYPKDTAKTLFNGDVLITYPYNMKGQKYQDDFTRTRVIVIEKEGIDVFFYFTMTDKGVKEFDKYLMDFKGVFLFNKSQHQ